MDPLHRGLVVGLGFGDDEIRGRENRIDATLQRKKIRRPERAMTEQNRENSLLRGGIADCEVEDKPVQKQIHFYASSNPFGSTSCMRDRFIRR